MPEPKSGALPLGDAPAGALGINQPGRAANPPNGRWAWDFCPVAGGGGHRYKGASRGGPSRRSWYRRVAQPGRALRSGRRGRRFESSLSDHFFNALRHRAEGPRFPFGNSVCEISADPPDRHPISNWFVPGSHRESVKLLAGTETSADARDIRGVRLGQRLPQ